MMDRIKIMHNGKTLEVLKNDVSKKIWQDLKDNRPLTTEEDFKPKDGGSSYATFEDKESKDSRGFVLCFCITAIFFYTIFLIYAAHNL